jgi:outer membrane protein, adhesin transport system
MTFARSCIPVVVLAAITATTVAHADDGTLTLEEAFKLALRYNDQFIIAAQNVEAADIRVSDAWTAIRPTITGTATAIISRSSDMGASAFSPGGQFEGSVVLRQPLFRKGFFASVDAERHAYASANATLARDRERVARDVAQVFISVLRGRAVVELSKGGVKRTTGVFDYAVNRVKAGNMLKTAELLADIDVKRAQRQLVGAERDLAIAEANFKRVVGRAPPAVLALPKPAPPPPTAAIEVAKKREDIQALELSIRESNALADAARGTRFWPQLDLQAGASYFAPDLGGRTMGWQVLGVLTIPLLQSGREANEIALRENAAHVAQLQLDFQRKLLGAEVESAWAVVETATTTLELVEKQLKIATDHYALVDKQFRLGAITFLEVTNGIRALAEAELAIELARMDRLQAIYEYLFVIGAIDLAGSTTQP